MLRRTVALLEGKEAASCAVQARASAASPNLDNLFGNVLASRMADADAAKRLDAVTARVRAFAADAVARRSRTHAEAPQALRAPL
eukprot:scaffold6193_cov123-Isochrysis_galbana.AAC.9